MGCHLVSKNGKKFRDFELSRKWTKNEFPGLKVKYEIL